MAWSFRRFFESLMYAGLKPTGSGPSDPLYLSNRTWKQKLRIGLLVSAPVLVVIGVAAYGILRPPAPADRPPASPTAAEVAARTAILPDHYTLAQNDDLQILEVSVDRDGGMYVAGTLKNSTSRRYAAAELAFQLTDEQGSQVGGVDTRVEKIDPHGEVRFRFPIAQKNAAFVLVREVRGLY